MATDCAAKLELIINCINIYRAAATQWKSTFSRLLSCIVTVKMMGYDDVLLNSGAKLPEDLC